MKIVKKAVLSALISLGVFQAQADQTNVVQNLAVHLRGVQPGGPVTNQSIIKTGLRPAKIENRDIITALGTATSNLFSRAARLVIVTPLGGGDSSIQVRDGNLQVEVTGFFRHEQVSESVSGSVSNPATHRTVGLEYSIQRFALRDAEEAAVGLHFDVRGFAAERSPDNSHGGVGQLHLDAAGTGDAGGNLLILDGKIEVLGGRLEVVPSVALPTT